jgi:serine/threonine protein phosphatase PrpC
LSDDDFYLIVGSDGLFDVVEEEEIIEMSLKYENQPQQLAQQLVNLALKNWTEFYPVPSDFSQQADNTSVITLNLPRYFQQFK